MALIYLISYRSDRKRTLHLLTMKRVENQLRRRIVLNNLKQA